MALTDFYILNFAMRRIKSPRFASQGLRNTTLQIPATEHNYSSPFPYQNLGRGGKWNLEVYQDRYRALLIIILDTYSIFFIMLLEHAFNHSRVDFRVGFYVFI